MPKVCLKLRLDLAFKLFNIKDIFKKNDLRGNFAYLRKTIRKVIYNVDNCF